MYISINDINIQLISVLAPVNHYFTLQVASGKNCLK